MALELSEPFKAGFASFPLSAAMTLQQHQQAYLLQLQAKHAEDLVLSQMNRNRSPNHDSNEVNTCQHPQSSISPDMLHPVKFNMLGQMQIRKPSVRSPSIDSINSGVACVIPSLQSPGSGKQDVSQASVTTAPGKTKCKPEADSPLDFSTKKIKIDQKEDLKKTDDPDSPCSRLRNILIMKSPSLDSDAVLNLSKETPISPGWLRGNSNRSSSSSPLDDKDIALDTQKDPVISSPKSLSAACSNLPPNPISGNLVQPGFSSFGVFAPSLSPIVNPILPNGGLPLPFELGSPSFPQNMGGSSTSPTLPFGGNLSMGSMTNGALPLQQTSGSSKGRATRPFKAYPKDPLTFPAVGLYGLPLGSTSGTEALIHQQSNQAYAEFRKQMLSQSHGSKNRRSGSTGLLRPSTSPGQDSSMEPINFGLAFEAVNSSAEDSHSASDDGSKSRVLKSEQQLKDEAYWERRRKNNEAAKRSRDARRAKEDEIAIRAAFLEQENLKLRFELCALKNDMSKLRCMFYNS